MNLIRKSIRVCMQKFRLSLTDIRIWMTLVVVAIFIFVYEKDIFDYAQCIDAEVTPWLFPFLNGQKFMRIILLLGPVLFFCNAPFVNSSNINMVIRAGRNAVTIGNILYIILFSIIYYLFIIIFSILPFVFNLDWSFEWGTALGTLSMYPSENVIAIISGKITTYFSPLQAICFTFLLSVINSVFLGFLIYATNSITKTRFMGTLLAVFFILCEPLSRNIRELMWASPVSWSNIDYLSISKADNLPTFEFAIISYAIIIIVMVTIIFFTNRYSDIRIIEGE
ncbi:MAG: hypothetical protein J1E85_09590 [Ruminococcus sp.]|nr:hypothetical protein [Ruminococcus sp.]